MEKIGTQLESEAEAKKPRPYLSLNAWRGVACIIVIMYHATDALFTKFPVIDHSRIASLSGHGYLGVQMFFVISGYCIAQAAISSKLAGRSVPCYLKSRARRIFLPYWFSLPLFAALNFGAFQLISHGVLSRGKAQYVDFGSEGILFYVANLGLLQMPLHQMYLNFGIAWTLNYEIAFYAIVAAALYATANRGASQLVNLCHALTVGCLVWLCVELPARVPFPFDLWPQFGLGMLVHDVVQHADQRRWGFAWTAMAVAALFGVLSLRILTTQSQSSREAVQASSYLFCLVFAALLAILHRFDEWTARVAPIKQLLKIGVYSYSIYLIHPIVLAVISVAARVARWPGDALPVQILFWILVVAPLLAAWPFFLRCEKPFMGGGSRTVAAKSRELLASSPAVATATANMTRGDHFGD